MGTHLKAGFTIIETTLVLGITGALVIGIFMGVGTQINVQRYRDSVESFKNLLQEQYSELASIRNDRANSWSCNGSAQTSQASPEVRGQSDCVMLGRLLTVQSKNIKQYTVLGSESLTPTAGLNDIASLRNNYTLNVSSVVVEEDVLEWNASAANPAPSGNSTPRDLSILFIRSPDSGQIYTFTSNTVAVTPGPVSLRNMLIAGNTVPGQGQQTICVNANNPLINDSLGVYMASYAAGPSAFEIRSNEYWQQAGSTTRC